MLDLTTLPSAPDKAAALRQLVDGDVFVHLSAAKAEITIHHTGGYLSVAGMLNATESHRPNFSRFDRIDPTAPIYVVMRDRGDGAYLCWWAQ